MSNNISFKLISFSVVFIFLFVALCIPAFAGTPIDHDHDIVFYGSIGQTVFPDRDNIYSLTRYGQTSDTYLISGTSFSNYDDSTKSLLISLNTEELNFVYGQTYNFSLKVYQHPSYTSDELANLSFLFYNDSDGLVDVPSNSSISSFGTLSVSFQLTQNITHIDIVLVGHIPKSSNRFHCILSPFHIGLLNTADMGGSFDEEVPTIPEVNIDSYLSDFDSTADNLLQTLQNGFLSVSGSVQNTAMFFSLIWNNLNEVCPELIYAVSFSLSFGVIAVILNIYAHAKSMGSMSARDRYYKSRSEYFEKRNKSKGGRH